MKKVYLLVSVIVVVLLLTGCFTTVSVKTLAPSKVNLGGKQVIAVAPATLDFNRHYSRRIPVYADSEIPVPSRLKNLSSSMDTFTADTVTEYLSQSIYEALSEGVYTIISPKDTKNYLLEQNNVTMLLESSVDFLDFEEYIEARACKTSDEKIFYNYYLNQNAQIRVSYRLIDAETGKTVDTYSYSGSYPEFNIDSETLIAQLDSDGEFLMASCWNLDCETVFENIIDSFKQRIRDRLVPHTVKLNFSLQDGTNREYTDINKLVEEGYLNIAYDTYKNLYDTTGDNAAGYNYAVLCYALGYPEEAISFIQTLYQTTSSSDAGKLLKKMQSAYSAEKIAKEQAGL